MRGLKVIEFRYREISDLLFDQPPFLIDYMILILVSDLIFILRNVVTEKFARDVPTLRTDLLNATNQSS